MKLWPRKATSEPVAERSSFTYGGLEYMLSQSPSLASSGIAERPAYFGDLAYAFATNPVVFAVCDVRSKALGEARFQFRQRLDGRPGKFFGTPDLLPIEQPWTGASTRDLIARMSQHVDLAGNAYVVRSGPGVKCLRPDWMLVVIRSASGSPDAPDAYVEGYQYHPGGIGTCSTDDIVSYLAEEVAHWMPTPDAACRHRGMSWLRTALCDIAADAEITDFKGRFFLNGATVSTVLTMPEGVQGAAFDTAVAKFTAGHANPESAHKTLFLAYGADFKAIGTTPEGAQMKLLQGAGETRIAAAAGVPPVIAGFSEGLTSTSYAAYDASRRRFADYTLRPLLGSLAEALETLIPAPGPDAFLTFDPRDISHFQEDTKDASLIQQQDAATISTLFMAGFEPASVVDAVTTGELTRLVHTGATSAQVTPPGGDKPETTPPPVAADTGGSPDA